MLTESRSERARLWVMRQQMVYAIPFIPRPVGVRPDPVLPSDSARRSTTGQASVASSKTSRVKETVAARGDLSRAIGRQEVDATELAVAPGSAKQRGSELIQYRGYIPLTMVRRHQENS